MVQRKPIENAQQRIQEIEDKKGLLEMVLILGSATATIVSVAKFLMDRKQSKLTRSVDQNIEAKKRQRQIESQSELPERGTGLITGNAGQRRGGEPRTDEERLERHNRIG